MICTAWSAYGRFQESREHTSVICPFANVLVSVKWPWKHNSDNTNLPATFPFGSYIPFPISSSCKQLFTGTYWQASRIQCSGGGMDRSGSKRVARGVLRGWSHWACFADRLGMLGRVWCPRFLGEHVCGLNLSCIIQLYLAFTSTQQVFLIWPHFEVRGDKFLRMLRASAWGITFHTIVSMKSTCWRSVCDGWTSTILKMSWPLQRYCSLYLHVCSLFSQSHN